MDTKNFYVGSRDIAEQLGISQESARKMMRIGMFGTPIEIGVGNERKHLRVQTEHFLDYMRDIGSTAREVLSGQGILPSISEQ